MKKGAFILIAFLITVGTAYAIFSSPILDNTNPTQSPQGMWDRYYPGPSDPPSMKGNILNSLIG